MYTERQKQILQYLSEVSFAKVEQLSSLFDVSIETIRRDLLDLEKDGSIHRVRGGASYHGMRAKEIEFDKKKENHQEEKLSIVRAAVEHISNNEAIMISNGSINIMLAKELVRCREDLTVITNSLEAAFTLNENESFNVIVTGGTVRKLNRSMIGSVCLSTLDQFRVDKAIINIDGFTVKDGVTEYNTEEAAVLSKMLESSRTKIVLCESMKLSCVALNRVCASREIDIVFTDWRVSERTAQAMEELGVRVIPGNK